MKIVIQRTINANVSINNVSHSSINKGLVLFIGIENDDNKEDLEWLCSKVANLRIFSDENHVMNLSIKDIKGEFLIISQFTLHASTKKGNRPSYIKAAAPEIALPLYNQFIANLKDETQLVVKTGVFGADMKIHLINDGPVTIIIDSKNRI